MRIAVTGSTGFVGSNVATVLQLSGHDVMGLIRRQPNNPLPWQTQLVDFSDIDSLTAGTVGVDAIVHCAIANDFNKLLADPPAAYDAYVGMTGRVTHAANRNNAHVVYISTDWIMDGTGHLEPENHPGNAVNFYGYLKALGEQVIRDLAPTTGAICRIAGVMGRHQLAESPRSQDVGFGYFVYSLVEALHAGLTFDVWMGDRVNLITTPSLAAEIGAQVERVITLGAAGTFHLVGDDAIGRWELAQLVCDVFELDAGLLRQSEPPADQLFPAAVPVDSSLSNVETKKALTLGPTSLVDLLRVFKAELETHQMGTLTRPLRLHRDAFRPQPD
jgi:dTDP-4-dehydrorhamnose reductase